MSAQAELECSNEHLEKQQHGRPLSRASLQLLYLVALATIAFVLRCYIYHQTIDGDWSRLIYPDERNYYQQGAQLFLDQGWNYFLTPRSLWNAPLPVLMLALFQMQVGWLKIFYLFLITLSSILVWDAARRHSGYLSAWIAFLCMLLHQPFWVFGPTILSEPLFTFLLTLFAWILLACPNTLAWSFTAGITIGLACYARPTPQYFVLILFSLGLMSFFCSKSRRITHNTLLPIALGFGMLLCISPWIFKNFQLFGKMGMATGSGAVLYLGNDLRKDGDEPVYSQMDFDTFEITAPHTHLDVEGDRILAKVAFDWFSKFPADIVLLSLKKFLRLVIGNPAAFFYPSSSWSEIYRHGGALTAAKKTLDIFLTLALTVLGLVFWSIGAGQSYAALCIAALIWYFFLLHSLAFAIPRMLLPIFPLLAVGSAGAVQMLVRKSPGFKIILCGGLVILISFLWLLNVNWRNGREKIPSRHLDYYSKNYLMLSQSQGKVHHLKHDADLLRSTGRDPFLEFEFEPVELKSNQVFTFYLSARRPKPQSSSHSVQIFWRSVGQQFSEERSITMPITFDAREHLYRLSPSLNSKWQGKLIGLRFDFPNKVIDAEYQLRELSLRK